MGSGNQILVHALMCQVISPAPILVILTKYILIFFTESFWEDLEDFHTENIRLGKVPTQRVMNYLIQSQFVIDSHTH